MTASRVRSSQRIRINAERHKEKLLGTTPVVEDWHAKMTFLKLSNQPDCHFTFTQVAWKRLFSASSKMDGATLYQLRNLINRRNVVKDVTKNEAACEEFFALVVESHIISAAMTIFNMKSIDDEPQYQNYFPPKSCDLDSLQRRNILIKR